MSRIEVNAFNMPNEQYQDKKSRLLEKMSPIQTPVFLLVEGLYAMEQARDGEYIHTIRWNYGAKTEEYLFDAFERGPNYLPHPDPNSAAGYISFIWETKNRKGESRGYKDIRFSIDENCMELWANLGRFEEVEDEIKTLVDPIDFPVLAWDQFRFVYKNPAQIAFDSKFPGGIEDYDPKNLYKKESDETFPNDTA